MTQPGINYQALLDNYSIPSGTPSYGETTLGNFRRIASDIGEISPEVTKFLKDTETIPGSVIVIMTPGKVALLVDDGGHLLEWA